jgi:hypothetical protein
LRGSDDSDDTKENVAIFQSAIRHRNFGRICFDSAWRTGRLRSRILSGPLRPRWQASLGKPSFRPWPKKKRTLWDSPKYPRFRANMVQRTGDVTKISNY